MLSVTALKSLLILHIKNLFKWAINLCARSQRGIQYSIFCVCYTWIIHLSFVSNSSRNIYFLLLSLTIFSDSTSRSNKEKMIFHLSGFVYKCTYSQHLQANIYLGKLKLTLSFGYKIQCNTRLLSINKDIRFNWPFGWLAYRFI